jgi:PTS system galactitol-specific IIA component
MAHLFRPELCLARLDADADADADDADDADADEAAAAADADDVIRALSRGLERLGLVRPSFVDAVLAREAASPTGLPLPGRKVAIPHADPEHVAYPAVAVATLVSPVTFHEMGNPQSELPVELVALLALTDKESAQEQLVALIERFQDAGLVDRLVEAPDAATLYGLLAGEEADA